MIHRSAAQQECLVAVGMKAQPDKAWLAFGVGLAVEWGKPCLINAWLALVTALPDKAWVGVGRGLLDNGIGYGALPNKGLVGVKCSSA